MTTNYIANAGTSGKKKQGVPFCLELNYYLCRKRLKIEIITQRQIIEAKKEESRELEAY